jgi:phosphoglucomutase
MISVSPLAGQPADPSILINVPKLVTAYYTERPDPSVPAQRVVFGTSGHRGSSLDTAFNEARILAIMPESIYKIYAESFNDQVHLDAIVAEAQAIVSTALGASAPNAGSREERP